MKRSIAPREVQDEILDRVSTGEKVPELAQEYGISAGNIYNWISTRKTKDPDNANKQMAGNKAPMTIEEQIDALTHDYQTKLKALLIKQLSNNLRMMSL